MTSESSFGPEFSPRLLAWYQDEKRPLPWRERTSPYRVWISEVMLQQTQVQTALPYFERWLERFPDVAALAAASLDEVLRTWAGLGYYSRARNTHRAAQVVVAEHAGELPHTFEALRRLPGIGPYTAGAIASIAFAERVAAVDGNVLRVFARLFAEVDERSRSQREKRARLWVEGLLADVAPGDFNQALMELGATICKPRQPLCAVCPVSQICRFPAAPPVDLKVKKKSRPLRHRVVAVGAALFDQQGRLLLMRRLDSGLLGGLWELPSEEIVRIEGTARTQDPKTGNDWLDTNLLEKLRPFLAQRLGVNCEHGPLLAPVHHTFSHIDYTLVVCASRCDTLDNVRVPEERYSRADVFTREQLDTLGLSSLTQKGLTLLFQDRA
ncbi:MAG: A/G-specific adenine glycosylase [Deltaproteobacteria bacterium CG2_30_63_29]|nr:MAG: A/G-specific adenine glycosylase [Deltaproteobacteria bacterium CG2_30_63_29]